MIDGNKGTNAKPDPEVFLKGAREAQADPSQCVVFEDALAGIEAARNAGMFCVGVGDPDILSVADLVIPGFEAFTPAGLIRSFNRKKQGKRDN
ncbi:MAG: HAD-IA family hydrolase [Prolixibacteraceae bacterium]